VYTITESRHVMTCDPNAQPKRKRRWTGIEDGESVQELRARLFGEEPTETRTENPDSLGNSPSHERQACTTDRESVQELRARLFGEEPTETRTEKPPSSEGEREAWATRLDVYLEKLGKEWQSTFYHMRFVMIIRDFFPENVGVNNAGSVVLPKVNEILGLEDAPYRSTDPRGNALELTTDNNSLPRVFVSCTGCKEIVWTEGNQQGQGRFTPGTVAFLSRLYPFNIDIVSLDDTITHL